MANADQRYRDAVARNIKSARELCSEDRRHMLATSILDVVRSLVPHRLYNRLGIRNADRVSYRQEVAEVQALQFAAAILRWVPTQHREKPGDFRVWLQIEWWRQQDGAARMRWLDLYHNGLWLLDPTNVKAWRGMNVLDFEEPGDSFALERAAVEEPAQWSIDEQGQPQRHEGYARHWSPGSYEQAQGRLDARRKEQR